MKLSCQGLDCLQTHLQRKEKRDGEWRRRALGGSRGMGIREHAGDYTVVERTPFNFVDDYSWRVQLVLCGLLCVDKVAERSGDLQRLSHAA